MIDGSSGSSASFLQIGFLGGDITLGRRKKGTGPREELREKKWRHLYEFVPRCNPPNFSSFFFFFFLSFGGWGKIKL